MASKYQGRVYVTEIDALLVSEPYEFRTLAALWNQETCLRCAEQRMTVLADIIQIQEG